MNPHNLQQGSIDYQEMNKMLRREAEIDTKLRVGAAGKIETKAKNKIGLHQSGALGGESARTPRVCVHMYIYILLSTSELN